jgi:hypothetical protein
MPPKKIKKAVKAAGTAQPAATDLHSHKFMTKVREAFRFHGGQPRGADFPPGSALFEGRFGRMFRTLPGAEFDKDDLKDLGEKMIAEPEDDETSENEDDPEENRGISAGYTYLGQFIDHDLTFDPASSLDKQNDPDALEDFRTPRFDLDSLYGRGPNDQPYLYEDNGVRMLLGEPLAGSKDHAGKVDKGTRDLPRNNPKGGRARALIGDPRNDENVIVSQLHATMLRFHNSAERRALALSMGGTARLPAHDRRTERCPSDSSASHKEDGQHQTPGAEADLFSLREFSIHAH